MKLGSLLLLLFVVASAHANELTDDGDAFCSFAGAVAKSESALLVSPQLFLDYGFVNGNDALGQNGVTTLPATQRLTIGARYSLSSLLAGLAERQRAHDACEQYRAQAALARFIIDNREGGSPAALDAKLAVLRGAAERAGAIVAGTRAAVERSRATIEELHAAELRRDELTASIAETEALRAGLPARTSLPSAESLVTREVAAADEVERDEARLRWARGVDLSVRGGYDQVFGVRNDVPLFAVVSLTINPAVVYQPIAEREATDARHRWTRLETDGVAHKALLLASRLRALLSSEERRLAESTTLLADVEDRLRAVEAVGSERLNRVRDAMWFDWVRAKAEHEFLRVHTGELAALVGAP